MAESWDSLEKKKEMRISISLVWNTWGSVCGRENTLNG
jgi:hypothetical protein